MLLKTDDGQKVVSWSNVNVFELILKVSDFGLCRQLCSSKPSDSRTMTVVGSVNWLAPEVKRAMILEARSEFSYSKYSDIWGCGCVSYYMAKKKPPGDVSKVYHSNSN